MYDNPKPCLSCSQHSNRVHHPSSCRVSCRCRTSPAPGMLHASLLEGACRCTAIAASNMPEPGPISACRTSSHECTSWHGLASNTSLQRQLSGRRLCARQGSGGQTLSLTQATVPQALSQGHACWAAMLLQHGACIKRHLLLHSIGVFCPRRAAAGCLLGLLAQCLCSRKLQQAGQHDPCMPHTSSSQLVLMHEPTTCRPVSFSTYEQPFWCCQDPRDGSPGLTWNLTSTTSFPCWNAETFTSATARRPVCWWLGQLRFATWLGPLPP